MEKKSPRLTFFRACLRDCCRQIVFVGATHKEELNRLCVAVCTLTQKEAESVGVSILLFDCTNILKTTGYLNMV